MAMNQWAGKLNMNFKNIAATFYEFNVRSKMLKNSLREKKVGDNVHCPQPTDLNEIGENWQNKQNVRGKIPRAIDNLLFT